METGVTTPPFCLFCSALAVESSEKELAASTLLLMLSPRVPTPRRSELGPQSGWKGCVCVIFASQSAARMEFLWSPLFYPKIYGDFTFYSKPCPCLFEYWKCFGLLGKIKASRVYVVALSARPVYPWGVHAPCKGAQGYLVSRFPSSSGCSWLFALQLHWMGHSLASGDPRACVRWYVSLFCF